MRKAPFMQNPAQHSVCKRSDELHGKIPCTGKYSARNIFRDVKHTHSETNYDHLIKIITPGKEGEKDTYANTGRVCNLV